MMLFVRCRRNGIVLLRMHQNLMVMALPLV